MKKEEGRRKRKRNRKRRRERREERDAMDWGMMILYMY